MGSISRNITPLAINSLGGEHTYTHTKTHTHTDVRTETILRNQAHTSLQPAHAWFKKRKLVKSIFNHLEEIVANFRKISHFLKLKCTGT